MVHTSSNYFLNFISDVKKRDMKPSGHKLLLFLIMKMDMLMQNCRWCWPDSCRQVEI